jgi:hypothetical protein
MPKNGDEKKLGMKTILKHEVGQHHPRMCTQYIP